MIGILEKKCKEKNIFEVNSINKLEKNIEKKIFKEYYKQSKIVTIGI